MFELIDNKVVIPPSSLTIPEMKAIWDRDKKKDKTIAFMELCYVFHLSDNKSEYSDYPDAVRKEKVLNEQIKDSKWKSDDLIESAIVKYKESKLTASSRYLESQEGLLDKITKIINDIDIEDLEDEKSMNTVLGNSEKATKIILSLPKLKEQVAKEQSISESIRGGGSVGMFEG
jgi:hypothetical protein